MTMDKATACCMLGVAPLQLRYAILRTEPLCCALGVRGTAPACFSEILCK